MMVLLLSACQPAELATPSFMTAAGIELGRPLPAEYSACATSFASCVAEHSDDSVTGLAFSCKSECHLRGADLDGFGFVRMAWKAPFGASVAVSPRQPSTPWDEVLASSTAKWGTPDRVVEYACGKDDIQRMQYHLPMRSFCGGGFGATREQLASWTRGVTQAWVQHSDSGFWVVAFQQRDKAEKHAL